tara:strand:- start:62 stop:868 length:807 start_codon:yes stop_codon:yes gene_type:complete
MLKIVWIGGNHPRHLYYLSKINEIFPIDGAIIEIRDGDTSSRVPEIPIDLNENDKKNFSIHFENRFKAEEKYFSNLKTPTCPVLHIKKEELNSNKTVKFIQSISPDIVLTFGCHMIKDPLMSKLPINTINLHGGLSPRYRGVATMFWPFYFLEPNHVGATFHYLTSIPDAGSIIHQSVPKLEYGDKIHDVACKTIISASEDIVKLLSIFEKDGDWVKVDQKRSSRNFLDSDFKSEHLRVIYNLFNDDIVDQFLSGKIKSLPPKLVTQF